MTQWDRRFEEALIAAHVALHRPVTTKDILQYLGQRERSAFEVAYGGNGSEASRRILKRLVDARRARRAGRMGRQNAYLPTAEYTRGEAQPRKSKRQRVLDFVRERVHAEGRALLLGELTDALQADDGLTKTDVRRAVSNLKRTGDLVVAKRVRGDERGGSYYLPAEMDVEKYRPHTVPWLERVADVCRAFFEARQRDADARGRRTFRPAGTADLRSAFAKVHPEQPQLADPQLFVNALKQVAAGRHRALRAIRRPGMRHLLWAPAGTTDDDLDLGSAYATDSERVQEAVTRARKLVGRPVTLEEVKHQVHADATLRPAGSQSLADILADTAREVVAGGPDGKVDRVTPVIQRVASVQGRPHYTTMAFPNDEGWGPYATARDLWDDVRAEAADISNCRLAAVREGRRLLLSAELGELTRLVDEAKSKGVPKNVRAGLQDLEEQVQRFADGLRQALVGHHATVANTACPTWLPGEVRERFEELYPAARRLARDSAIVPLLDGAVRRVSITESQAPESRGRRHEQAFDQVSMLELACARWGGPQASRAGSYVAVVLGPLRDPRFLVTSASEEEEQGRIAAAYCLAFFDVEIARQALQRMADTDPSRGVRNAASWGLALSSSLACFPAAPELSWALGEKDPLVKATRKNVAGMRLAQLIQL